VIESCSLTPAPVGEGEADSLSSSDVVVEVVVEVEGAQPALPLVGAPEHSG